MTNFPEKPLPIDSIDSILEISYENEFTPFRTFSMFSKTKKKFKFNVNSNENESKNATGEDTYAGALRAPRAGSPAFVSVFVFVLIFGFSNFYFYTCTY